MSYHRSGIQLIDDQNRRKYIDQDERLRFIEACYSSEAKLKCFGLALMFTGGRITEVLSICDKHVEVSANRVRIKTLKRRHTTVIRHVPLPIWFIDMLSKTFDLKTNNSKLQSQPIWSWSRSTASRKVKRLMELADIIGKQASAKGLRHGFAVHAISSGVPISIVSKWLGHATLDTTLIYLQFNSAHEREYAERMWKS